MNSKYQSLIGIFLILAVTWMSVGRVASAATLDVPSSFATIQAAIDVAVDGDIVRVAPGTYFENLTLENNTITLTSHFIDSGDTSFIDQTIIDGGGFSNNVILVKSSVGVGTTIQGLTIRNGNNGVDIQGPLQFLNNRVTGTRDAVDYAASTSNVFTGLVKNCEIDNNNDDAVDLDGPVSVTIENSYLHDNGDDGIEVRLTAHNLGLEINVFNNIIENNAEDGIQLIQLAGVVSDRVFRIEGNLIIDNAFAGIGLSTETTQNFEGANLEERIHVTNNTFVRNDHGISGGNNLIALNNLFVDTTNIALNRVDDTSIAAFNLFFGNGQDFSESEVDIISSVFQDPLLDANDEITSLSPAVDAGTAFYMHNSEVVLDLPSNAFNGLAPDMGHVETDGTPSNQPPTASITAPADGSSFTVGDNITFTATGTDPEDGDVTASLTWDSDLDGAVGTGGSFTTTLSEGTHTITATATDSGSMTGSDTITVNVLPSGGGTTTLSIPINLGSDDAEEKSDGKVVIGSIDIDLIRSGSDQTVGLRFNNVTIPQGSTIVDAYIQFTAQNINSGTTSLTVEGEAADNALTFVNNINGNISSRPRTTAAIGWSPAPWTTAGDAVLDQRTPNLTPIVQEIVNQGGWVSNNSLAVIITGTGLRDAESFEANAAAAAVLHVEYANVGGNQPPTASISAPADGSNFTFGDNITFTGTGTDPEDGDVTASLTWDSNLDGAIGTGGSFSTTALSEGTYTITATTTDSGSMTGSDTISITVTAVGNTPPTALISAPVDGSSFTVGDNITFTATGTDPEDGDVTASLTWDSDLDGAVGSGGSFSTTLSEGTHTITATATDSGNMMGSDTVTVTVTSSGGGTTLSIPINLGSDDAEEKSDGKVVIGSIDIDLIRSGSDQTVGLRFNEVTIPQGASIVNAYIQFTAQNINSGTTSLTLEGEATDNALTFVNNINGNISTRSRTTAAIAWSPAPWTTAGDAGLDQRTPDLTPIVQEIVNQGGWVSNNSLALIITGTGLRDAESFEANAAAAAVLHVEYANVGANQPPAASITAPADGSSFTVGESITFTGTGTDPEDSDVTSSLTWDSNLDGAIGTDGSFSTTLSEGAHTITATASDSGSMTGSDTISITVTAVINIPPTASISAPADGANFTVGENIAFTGTGTDTEDGDVTSSLIWDSDLDGAVGTGGSFSTTLSEGTHTITATATDSGSMTGSDTISITVTAAANTPPTASISAPADGANFTVGENIAFTGTGTDTEDGDVTSSLTWESNLDGAVGAGGSFSTTLSEGIHTITTTATDSGSLTGNDTITVTILPPGGGTTTLSIPINAGSDDSEELTTGRVILGSKDLDLVFSGGNQTVGLRFNGVTIPQGVTIVDAYIQFATRTARSETTSLTVEGEAADNAITFVNNINGNISSRPRTTADIAWSPTPWTTVGETGVDQRTPNLASIVQEIVDRDSWASSNSLAFIITGTGKRDAQSFETPPPASPPVLHVEYQ